MSYDDGRKRSTFFSRGSIESRFITCDSFNCFVRVAMIVSAVRVVLAMCTLQGTALASAGIANYQPRVPPSDCEKMSSGSEAVSAIRYLAGVHRGRVTGFQAQDSRRASRCPGNVDSKKNGPGSPKAILRQQIGPLQVDPVLRVKKCVLAECVKWLPSPRPANGYQDPILVQENVKGDSHNADGYPLVRGAEDAPSASDEDKYYDDADIKQPRPGNAIHRDRIQRDNDGQPAL